MATGKISNRSAAELMPGAKDSYLWDNEISGFGLKVTPKGAKTFIFAYRIGGREAQKRKYTIGKLGTWTPATAREEAARLSRLVNQQIDPALDAKRRRRQAVDLEFATYVEKFVALYLKERWKGGWELAAGVLQRQAVPYFKGQSLADISRADIARFLEQMPPSVALRRNTFAALRRMFRWAISRQDLEDTPFRNIDPPPAPQSRDRILSDEELGVVWKASESLAYPFEPFFKLLVLTGQRRSEVAEMDWRELDRGAMTWTIPASRAKNGLISDVPLSEGAIAVLDHVASLLGSEESKGWPRQGWVFSSKPGTHISGYSSAKRRLDKMSVALMEKGGSRSIAPWRIHDIRRTVATGLQRLGIGIPVTEALLNHVSGTRSGIVGVYQRYEYAPEKRHAMQEWANHVLSLPKRGEVTPA